MMLFCFSGPDDKLFKRLRTDFESLEDSTPVDFYEFPNDVRQSLAKKALDWATQQMEKEWPRSDYRELIELISVYLSGDTTVQRSRQHGLINLGFTMHKPGFKISLLC